MKQVINKYSRYMLTLLVAADLAFIALGILYECGFANLFNVCHALNLNSYFSITRDRGYAEVFQYIKEYWLIILFLFLAIEQNLKIYSGWVFLAIYLLLDDALEIHEKLGAIIAEQLNYIYLFNLRPQDYGELTIFAIVGVVFFLWISLSYRWANSRERKIFRHLIGILFGLAVFAIAIDTIHAFLDHYVFWNSTLAIIEDGGEHIVMSILVCYVISVVTNSNKRNFANKQKEAFYNHN